MKKNLLLLPSFASFILINHTLSSQNIGGYDPLGRRFWSTVQTAVPLSAL